ncbi:hypothetical protein PM082_013400 [Marasmius tenuissimus]|nr:hypothetical protein PM082_013400 [Marasmius tenuissimus]
MHLSWIDVEAQNVQEVLWYLHESPPGSSPKSVRPPPEVTIVERPVPSLFALIIGINDYQDTEINNLKGCVPDADAFESLLKDVYRVPSERIKNLRNEQATRQAMLQAIEDLADSPRIGARDPIAIFYAGHGGEVKSDTTGKMIQFLLPYDFIQKGSSTQEGQGIFDITLSRLLTKIAKKKSDNITVILDSCHSGSGTRDDERDKTFAVRGVELPSTYTIPAGIIEDELKAAGEQRDSNPAPGTEMAGLRSHVLLAACKHGQTSKERGGSGDFSSQLIPLLREDGLDQITYRDVINRLQPLPDNQNPQCEGVNSGRIIFDGKVAAPHRPLYNIRCVDASTNRFDFVVEAGEAHGVTKDAEFAVYSDQKMKPEHLVGRVRAVKITPFNTGCSSLDGSYLEIPKPAYAILTRLGEQQDLRLYIEQRDEFLPLFKRIKEQMEQSSEDSYKRSFRLLNSPEEGCDLALSLKDDGYIQFDIMDPTCLRYGVRTMPFNDISPSDNPDYLLVVLQSAADFYWNLHHSNKEGKLAKGKVTTNVKPGEPVKNLIELECFKLVPSGELTPDLEDVYKPEQGGENLNVQGTININIVEGDQYGFSIKNNSNVPLFAALLYFNINDLSVESYYMSPVARDGETDPSIPAGQSLDIGWGDSGTIPRSYTLRRGRTIDVGFLKLYLSTEYVDFSQVCQETPFVEERENVRNPGTTKRYLWDSMLVNIIQRDPDANVQN